MPCPRMEWWTDERIKRESFEKILIQENNGKYALKVFLFGKFLQKIVLTDYYQYKYGQIT